MSAATARRRTLRRVGVASVFLAPNVIGFLAFTLGPLVMSLALAFSNWDLRRHNQFHPGEQLQFVGLGNFIRLLSEPEAWRFLGNTVVLMIGIPLGIAGSLGAALLLNRDLSGGNRRVLSITVATVLAMIAVGTLLLLGLGASPMTWLIGGLFSLALLMGVTLGGTVYRTLLYLPSFTAGVATILLWKNLFNPNTGPINAALAPMLDLVSSMTRALPTTCFVACLWIAIALAAVGLAVMGRRMADHWRDGEIGTAAFASALTIAVLPFVVFSFYSPSKLATGVGGIVVVAIVVGTFVRAGRRAFRCEASEALGGSILIASIVATAQLVVLLLGIALWHLPAWAADGLNPPGWHTDYDWAKPAIIVIGLWAAIGSNNMLLYLAGLTGVPAELYEAADLDGATGLQRFWNITWPQLAPTTFFIVVMSIIAGLQGGFELARTMTKGGPAGSTTTLSYFIYTEGFETGRLGYSSAIAWVLFALVFVVTLINWKFGNRYVND